MIRAISADICVIGAGSAGLSVAAGAAQMGARTVLIEAARMGGDCLNTGCVPSKALLAAAKAAANIRHAGRFGVQAGEPQVDFAAVNRHVHDVIAQIAPHDSVERFTGLGCTVIQARARFVDERTVETGEQRIRARRFVIATGSRAAVPPIPGLADLPFFTNENIFENKALPEHLIVIGGGPIGCEMAQAHRRLGAKVSVLDLATILPKDDPDLVAIVRQALRADGITIEEGAKILKLERRDGGVAVVVADGEGERDIAGSHLLVAAGRRPNVEDLGLEAAGVQYSPKGIAVDQRLRTSNRRIFAAGDVAGSYQFTHLAGYHAGIVLRNALFRLPAKVDIGALPWVTYTDPELAHVGLTEAQAHAEGMDDVRVLTSPFAENDRARTERATEGLIKVVVSKRGQVLGAGIVGAHAGELILPWVLAVGQRMKIGALAGVIAPYPTLSEISKRAAGSYYTPTLFSPRTRRLVRMLRWLG
ncbi:Dihydrolipoamide dehydrogenase [Candidatus Defluviicoccus seviourii]|uniref:Dihydrolipoamide dehydrogenase n=1 Tax=Candidatus Defluviicoccus seviourii TaxID=2565273 RepID=A0A564WGW1_9PROT|nr:Dihydrolipoamide dehydrogenase [Candidatus Defluviicoccus seviourii]